MSDQPRNKAPISLGPLSESTWHPSLDFLTASVLQGFGYEFHRLNDSQYRFRLQTEERQWLGELMLDEGEGLMALRIFAAEGIPKSQAAVLHELLWRANRYIVFGSTVFNFDSCSAELRLQWLPREGDSVQRADIIRLLDLAAVPLQLLHRAYENCFIFHMHPRQAVECAAIECELLEVEASSVEIPMPTLRLMD